MFQTEVQTEGRVDLYDPPPPTPSARLLPPSQRVPSRFTLKRCVRTTPIENKQHIDRYFQRKKKMNNTWNQDKIIKIQ